MRVEFHWDNIQDSIDRLNSKLIVSLPFHQNLYKLEPIKSSFFAKCYFFLDIVKYCFRKKVGISFIFLAVCRLNLYVISEQH